MAKMGALKDCYIAINGTVVSNEANSIGLEDSADEIDITGFSTNGYKEITQGLKALAKDLAEIAAKAESL